MQVNKKNHCLDLSIDGNGQGFISKGKKNCDLVIYPLGLVLQGEKKSSQRAKRTVLSTED